MGHAEKSAGFLRSYKNFADNDKSVYRHINLAVYYSYLGDAKQAVEHLKLFSEEDNYAYWVLLYDFDTALDPIKGRPEFQKVMRDIETKFWDAHKKIKATLVEKRLI